MKSESKSRSESPCGCSRLRHEAEQIDDIDEANLQIGEVLLQNRDRRERFHGGDVAGAGHHHIGLCAVVGGGPIPDADALGAVGHGFFHGEVLQMLLLVGDDHVDVIARAQAMVGHAEQAVRIGRQIDADHVRALVGDHVKKSRVLMGEAVVVLPPDQRSNQDVDGRNRARASRVPSSISPATWRAG